MAKRGNGEGNIYQVRNRKTGKKDRWVGVYTARAPTGTKRREVSGKTRTEVAGKLARAIADRDGGLVFDAGKLTVGKYLDRWLADSVRDTVRLTTYQGYERIVRRHLKPTLGTIKLKSLTPTHVRGLYRERLDSGLAPRMVQLVHTTLHKALKQAVMDGLIPRNATEAVKAPKVGRKEITPLSAEQTKGLLQAAGDAKDRFETLYAVAVGTGMRQGELLGLKWEDVDIERGVLQVRRTLSTANGKGFAFGEPKTARSRRSIKLPALALAALKRHRTAQLEERMQLAGLWQDHDLVFANRKGNPVSRQDLITRSFKPLLRRARLPDVRFHDLRHTCATILLRAGKHPKYVQELLGHATISITLDTYSHVIEGMEGGLSDAIDEALG
ncbi:MAG: site-specific integrase [Rubrobacter sp.]